MILKEFAYKKTKAARQNDFELEKLSFSKLNLIVGKNASGKSKVLNCIFEFVDIINHNRKITYGKWDLSFLDEKTEIIYQLEIDSGKIINEVIFENNKKLLQRTLRKAKIYSKVNNVFKEISPPKDALIFSRRDTKEYPYLEKIVTWAESSYLFMFGEFNSKSSLNKDIGIKAPFISNLGGASNVMLM